MLVCLAVAARGEPGGTLPDSAVSTVSTEPLPLPITRDVLVSLSALVGAIVAYLGVSAWRRQLKGTTEYRIALQILQAVYALREAVIEARSPMIFPGDNGGTRAGMGPEELATFRAARLYQRRLARVGRARADLHLTRQQGLAVWGDAAQKALEDLFDAVDELFAACDRYFEEELARARRKDQSGKEDERDAESIALRGILYSKPVRDGRDAFGERIARAIARAEDFYRAHLK